MLERLPPSRHAARQKTYRRRQRAGVATALVEYDADVLAMLITTGWLCERDAADRGAIGKALSRMLAQSAKSDRG